ncbi:hypothetical protein BOW35_06580 [Solemya velum gill symbiont]|uniref:hypothetical protein n=1 Tax=Solemya velum gill symbiont TaxID=2340 RepID=UPI00099795E0|nr:hypothetical protein [Solemya velum gill symbiont]OOZ15018.1 hypothetical protein BOW27_06520 [Solemya velum gill symbiont]OOZ19659.1 hypothetical protein BOW29_06075 [Solemya velum gill symbiont]OOZ22573.1 hypothetical protein BOW30_05580 [Solemya velum gill symbiont]OOZ23019.1 hypothetical protein BOW31_09970 [Solemya velum gill symbiont]OOZ29440.1 hypothetical protein BOW33_05735 [Solemya velum gill symbiont]
MLTSSRFAYTQARLQVRHGLRLNEQQWRHLESQQGLANFLHVASESGMSDWLAGLHADDSIHILEKSFSKHFRDYVEQVSHWQPAQWRKATLWISVLPDLPLLENIRNRGEVPQWLSDDEELGPLLEVSDDALVQRLALTRYAPLTATWHSTTSMLESWRTHWKECWPDTSAKALAGVESVEALILCHRGSFMELKTHATAAARSELSKQLGLQFRRLSQQPAAVFAHLGLVALDVERLRGNVSSRALLLNSVAAKQ